LHLIIFIIANILFVDCGERTVDLVTRQLLDNERLGEKTIRAGGYCGGEFVDKGFLAFIGEKVGTSAIQIVEENHYGQLQYMVQEFHKRVKFLFTGNKEYRTFELDLDEVCPVIKQYVHGDKKEQLEEDEWIVDLKFEDVKKMFDPVIKKIIRLIHDQLDRVSAIFLVGGFSESKYLQKRIREEFSDKIRNICVPPQPTAVVVRGGNYDSRLLHMIFLLIKI
jgi:hypothetical protein